MKNVNLIIGMCFCFLQMLSAKNITGTVSDSQNNPLPGVNIVIQNTNIATTTDFDGKYNIEAEEACVIEFSYLGLKTQRILLKEQTIIDVIMQIDNSALSEVVVVGYGTLKKQLANSSSVRETISHPNFSIVERESYAPTVFHETEEEIDNSNESYASISENGFKIFSCCFFVNESFFF